MPRFLPSLLSTKTGTSKEVGAIPAKSRERFAGSNWTYTTQGVPYEGIPSVERALSDGMQRSIWTFKAVDLRAMSAARLVINLSKEGAAKGVYLDPKSNPLWKVLNYKANPWEFAIQFRYRMMTQYLLSKKGVFIEKVRDGDGNIVALFLLNPDQTHPIPDAKKFVSGFEVRVNGSPEIMDADDVLWIRKPHPVDPYLSWTVLDAAGISIDLDYYSRLYNRNFMANDGRPGGLLSIKSGMPDADAEILKARFTAKNKPGAISVIESEGVDWVDLSTSPRDAAYTTLRGDIKTEILEAWGTPQSLLGNTQGITYENAEAEENLFWRVTQIPEMDLLDLFLSSLTAPEESSTEIWAKHDTETIQALQRPQRENEQRAMEQRREGIISVNEARIKIGLKPYADQPGADALMLPAGTIGITPDEETRKMLDELTAVGSGAGATGEPQPPQSPDGPMPNAELPSSIRRLLSRSPQQALGPGTARSPETQAVNGEAEAGKAAQRRVFNTGQPQVGVPAAKGDDPSGIIEVKMDTKADQETPHIEVCLDIPYTEARHLSAGAPAPVDANNTRICVAHVKGDEDSVRQVVAGWAARTHLNPIMVGPTMVMGEDGRQLQLPVEDESLVAAQKDLEAAFEAKGVTVEPLDPHVDFGRMLPGGSRADRILPTAIRPYLDQVAIRWSEDPRDVEHHPLAATQDAST